MINNFYKILGGGKVKKILLAFCLITLAGCATKEINGKQQTFIEYVVLNKYSDYKGESKEDWDNQPSESFPGIRLIKWFKSN